MRKIRVLLAVALMAAVGVILFHLPLQATPPGLQPGVVLFADHAHIGAAPATAGSTIFSGDQLSTESAGVLQIRMGAARFLLAKSSTATLTSAGNSPTATLLSGTATFSTANARAFTLRFGQAAIRANTDEPTVGQVSVLGAKELAVQSTRGSLAFTVAGETRVVAEGAAYRVVLDPTPDEVAAATTAAKKEGAHQTTGPPAAAQQSTAPRAGAISRVIPSVTIARNGQTLEASPGSVVDWQDQINTLANARARVGLEDGSVLNIGSDSAMQVVKHDAGAQQTELQLNYGKLRARSQTVSRSDGQFVVHTHAGVANTAGADFYVSFGRDVMTVLVFAGEVRVCNLSGICVPVKSGEITSVSQSGTPLPPVPAPLALVTGAAADTDDGGEIVATVAPPQTVNHRSDKISAPIGAGSSKFIWYAIGFGALITGLGIHYIYESPDRP